MMATIPANNFILNFHQIQLHPTNNTHSLKTAALYSKTRKSKIPFSCYFNTNHNYHVQFFKSRQCFHRCRVTGDADAASQHSAVSDQTYDNLSTASESYVPLLIRMLGLDNDSRDREQAIIALWKYSLGGKHYVDNIMQFRGCLNLIVNLLMSQSSRACEAAAGLLRMISSVNAYRDTVAESGAVEETTALLRRPSLTSEVKEQSICMLWNLSADEKLSLKIANPTLLPLLIKCLDNEDMKVTEAAGGVLANLALSPSNHSIMVEAAAIPKLAKFLTDGIEGSKVIRKEAKGILLEFAKDDYYKIAVMEEGLILVPLVGPAAYASFRPSLHSWPLLPDGTELQRSTKVPSRYGASELLLGLNVEDNTEKIDELKKDAIVKRTQQQFLARIGAIEFGDERKSDELLPTSFHYTLLPWKDGVARLALILELEDEIAITRAADSIAAASFNETLRISFREAGAVKRLIHLVNHNSIDVQSAVLNALEKLSVSNVLRETMEAEGVTHILVNILRNLKTTESLIGKPLSILARIWDPNNQMKLKFYGGPVNGSRRIIGSGSNNGASGQGGNMLDWKYMLDSALVARLADILKTPLRDSQTKVASILEFLIMIEPSIVTSVATHVGSALLVVFEQNIMKDTEAGVEYQEPDVAFLEEAGLAVSAASRLLTKLLDYSEFHETIDSDQFTNLLRQILKSNIPLHYKDWVAACLVRLSLFSSPFENPITTEVTLNETIPRLIEQIKTSFADGQEAAVVELNRIISEGVTGAAQAVAIHGGIPPLIEVVEHGSDTATEAGLAVLYNLSMNSENHSTILAAGAVPVLRRIVHSQKPQWMRALHLMRNLPV